MRKFCSWFGEEWAFFLISMGLFVWKMRAFLGNETWIYSNNVWWKTKYILLLQQHFQDIISALKLFRIFLFTSVSYPQFLHSDVTEFIFWIEVWLLRLNEGCSKLRDFFQHSIKYRWLLLDDTTFKSLKILLTMAFAFYRMTRDSTFQMAQLIYWEKNSLDE